MILPPDFPAFLLAALVIEATPGPNMAWLAIVSATEGRRAGIAAGGAVLVFVAFWFMVDTTPA
jgi:threonine/homoserine/homoserine lactone efflux protein